MRRYVAGFMFHDADVALIEKQKPAWQRGLWNGIGGEIEEGETPEQAMVREFEEETGALVEGWQLVCVLTGADFQVYFFRLHVVRVPKLESRTKEQVRWFSIDRLPVTIPNLNWLVPMAFSERPGRGMPYQISEAA